METFRFLHISDLHFATRPYVCGLGDLAERENYPESRYGRCSSHDPDVVEAVARHAWEHRTRLEAILITGDLATSGDRDDLGVALRFVQEPATGVQGDAEAPWLSNAFEPTLAASGLPVYLLPGNHDRFRGPLRQSGGTEFDRVFADYWPGRDRSRTLNIFPRGAERLAIVAADFCLLTDADATDPAEGLGGPFAPFLGRGRVYDHILRDLEAETQRFKAASAAAGVIWAVHFPPRFARLESVLRLLDEHLLVDSASKLGVRYVLAGHTHEHRRYRPSELDLSVLCAGTSGQYIAPAGQTVHELEVDVLGARILDARWTTFRYLDGKFRSLRTLGDREREVFRLVGQGVGNREIAGRLDLSIETIQSHHDNIKAKLDIEKEVDYVRHAVWWEEREARPR